MSKAIFQQQCGVLKPKVQDKRHDGQRKAAERKQAARQAKQHGGGMGGGA